MALPREIRDGEDSDAAREIERDAEVAAVVAIDEDAAEEGHAQSGKGDDDDLHADGDRRVRCRKDVPAYGGEVEAAAEERDEHRHREVAEPALRPDDAPVDFVGCDGGGHGSKQIF